MFHMSHTPFITTRHQTIIIVYKRVLLTLYYFSNEDTKTKKIPTRNSIYFFLFGAAITGQRNP